MYQITKKFTNYTSYDKWLKFPFRPVAKRNFPLFFVKQTGSYLPKDWKIPPMHSVTKGYIDKMVHWGFLPQQSIDSSYTFTGLSLPLLKDKRQLAGFLAVYKVRRSHEVFRWVKYVHPQLAGANTPLISISGPFHCKPDAYLVDNLKDYFKLINWVYCQEKTYALGRKKLLPSIIYVDQGDEFVIEHMRCLQLHFKKITDFSGKFVEEIAQKINKVRGAFKADTVQYFDENPLPYCNTRLNFESIMAGTYFVNSTKNSFRRRILPGCSGWID